MDMRSTLLCSLLLAATAAHAEGVYVLASGGQSHLDLNYNRSDFDNAFLDNGDIVTSSKFDKSDSAYKLQLGYQLNENFSIEGGYIDLGKTEYKANLIDSLNNVGTNSTRFEAKGWNLDAVVTLPVNAGVSLFMKGGLFRADVKGSIDSSTATPPLPNDSSSKKKVRPNYGFGIAYNFYAGLSARAEVERFSRLEVGELKADVDLYSVGLSYQF